jgi:hypothetical protein
MKDERGGDGNEGKRRLERVEIRIKHTKVK